MGIQQHNDGKRHAIGRNVALYDFDVCFLSVLSLAMGKQRYLKLTLPILSTH